MPPKGTFVDDLTTLTISSQTKDALIKHGYDSLLLIVSTSVKELSADCDIPIDEAQRVINQATQNVHLDGFQTSTEVLAERRRTYRVLSTPSQNLNAIMGGGFETGGITEVAGQFAAGKTQLMHQLAVIAAQPVDEGGLGGCLFIDTENTFRPERILQMCQALKLDAAATMANIFVERAQTSSHQAALVRLADKQDEPVRCIIIDSFTQHFRTDYVGSDVVERQQRINRHFRDLHNFAAKHHAAIIITNQVVAEKGGQNTYGDRNQPSGGHIVAHNSTTRLYLKKLSDTRRQASLIDSPSQPTSQGIFTITTDGIRD